MSEFCRGQRVANQVSHEILARALSGWMDICNLLIPTTRVSGAILQPAL